MPNFKAIGVRICVLQQFLQVCEKTKKKKKKTKKINQTLAARISEMAGAISFKFGMKTLLAGGQLCSKFGSNQIRDYRDTKV